MPSRRKVLVTLLGASLSGCATREPRNQPKTAEPTVTKRVTGGTERPNETGTQEPSYSSHSFGQSASIDGMVVTLSNLRVQDSGFQPLSADSMTVVSPDDQRFVLCTARTDEPGVQPSRFSLHLAETKHSGNADFHEVYHVGGYTPLYGGDRMEGLLGFRIPAPTTVSDEEVRIQIQDDAWRFPEGAVKHLTRPKPSFKLLSFECPSEIRADEGFEVRVRVKNTGDVPGTFRGVLNVAGYAYAVYPYPFEFETSPDGEGTWRKQFEPLDAATEREVSIDLLTPAGERYVRANLS